MAWSRVIERAVDARETITDASASFGDRLAESWWRLWGVLRRPIVIAGIVVAALGVASGVVLFRTWTREAMAVAASDRPLFEALRAWRAAEAKTQHVPPYVIFHDRTLVEIASVKPGSRAALARLNGVGEAKLAHYGEAVLEVVGGFA